MSQGTPPAPPPGDPSTPHPAAVDGAAKWIVPIGRSGWAIAAGYAGFLAIFGVVAGAAIEGKHTPKPLVLAVCLLPALLTVAVSLIAMRHLRRHPKLLGWGRAVFGLVTGLLITAVVSLIFS